MLKQKEIHCLLSLSLLKYKSCIFLLYLILNKDTIDRLPHVLFLLFIRTDSEIFEDAVELQQFFIKIRDELCKNGEIMLSSALNYTLKHLNSDVEQEKREKIPKEIEEDKQKTEEEKAGKGVFA